MRKILTCPHGAVLVINSLGKKVWMTEHEANRKAAKPGISKGLRKELPPEPDADPGDPPPPEDKPEPKKKRGVF